MSNASPDSLGGIFGRIVDLNNLEQAYRQTQKGDGKYTNESLLFAKDWVYNLHTLRAELIDETWEFGDYIRFKVFEPKERDIDAPKLRAKIVQVAVNNVIKQVYFPSFINDSYACIDNKGTHRCVDRINRLLRKAVWEYGESAIIIKIDIRKFFYTIDRDVLKSLLPKKIKCKKTLLLLYKIIDSADVLDAFGLPLGNTLSQLGANIYMNSLDQFCKRKLSLRYYVRYADDIVITVKNREVAKETLDTIINFLEDVLKLQVNEDKTQMFPAAQGVNTVGFKIYKTHRLLRNDSKKKIKRKARKMRRLLIEGLMEPEKAEQILNSWLGHAEHGCSHNFVLKLVERNDYILLIDGKLRVDRELIKKERREYALQEK